jgi:hypothetical protein
LIVFPALPKVHQDPGFEYHPEKNFLFNKYYKKICFSNFSIELIKKINSWEKNSKFLLQAVIDKRVTHLLYDRTAKLICP